MDMEMMIYEGLMAFIPIYLAMKGNCTVMYTEKGGRHEIEKTTRGVIKQLCKQYFIDLRATKKYYGNLLNLSNLIPIPFNKSNIFIPVKTRRPICKNDGSFGYISIRHIKKIFASDDGASIQLTNNCIIKSISSIDTVNKHVKHGEIVQKLYGEREQSTGIRENYLCPEYDEPATKKDIAIVINEILKIKNDFSAG